MPSRIAQKNQSDDPVQKVAAETSRQATRVAILALIEHLGRALHSLSFSRGLNPAQWNALRYLERANPSAKNVTSFAKHHLTKKSAASETMTALAAKGLISSVVDPYDARGRILEVTPRGLALLAEDPFHAVRAGVDKIPDEDLDTIVAFMETLLRSLFAPTNDNDD
jgi:DNA-binding MarR family transcriptional regulator